VKNEPAGGLEDEEVRAMKEIDCLAIISAIHGSGFVSFFDEPFGERTPFDRAGGYLMRFDNGVSESGTLSTDDLAAGLDLWLKRKGWRIELGKQGLIHA
jgi:hypothetical protein